MAYPLKKMQEHLVRLSYTDMRPDIDVPTLVCRNGSTFSCFHRVGSTTASGESQA